MQGFLYFIFEANEERKLKKISKCSKTHFHLLPKVPDQSPSVHLMNDQCFTVSFIWQVNINFEPSYLSQVPNITNNIERKILRYRTKTPSMVKYLSLRNAKGFQCQYDSQEI